MSGYDVARTENPNKHSAAERCSTSRVHIGLVLGQVSIVTDTVSVGHVVVALFVRRPLVLSALLSIIHAQEVVAGRVVRLRLHGSLFLPTANGGTW